MKMHKALHSIDDIDYMCREKMEEDDSPVLKIDCMQQYDNPMTT